MRTLDYHCAPRLRPGIHAIILSPPAAAERANETGGPGVAALRPAAVDARTFDDAPSMSMYLTSHDPLTGLANRRMLEARFGDCAVRAAGRHASIAILRLDLDGFAAVNRSLGESAGDETLRRIARRLAATAGPEALVARERSDSFIVLLPEPDLPGSAEQFADRLLRAIAEPFELGGGPQRITASAGLALYPQDGRNLDTLLRNAKSALEQARRLGGNCCSAFRTRLDGPGFDSSQLERGLRHALQTDELTLHFQPWSMHAPAAPVPARPCCAGATPTSACCPTASSWVRSATPACSPTSATGCWPRPAAMPPTGLRRTRAGVFASR